MSAIWQKGVAELAAGFAARRLEPVAVLESCLERIGRIDPQLNSIVTLDAAGARIAAEASARRWANGTALSPHA